MKRDPDKAIKNSGGWFASRIQLLIKHRQQIIQILLAMIFFLFAVGSLQYLPQLAVWFHISDLFFGKVMVYSLPLWIALAFFLIWRS